MEQKQLQNVKAYNVDCMLLLKDTPDKYYDLAIVDPPYGLPKSSIHGRGLMRNRILGQESKKMSTWDIAPTEEYFKELFRVSKNQIIWGGNYFDLPPTRCIICWDKVQPWENFSQIEYAWTSFDYPAKLFRYDNRTGSKIHPTQKPVELYKWLLTNFAEVGMKLLDTHSGSGVLAIASDGLHDITLCETDPIYYKLSFERIERQQQQLKLNL
jgi:site-specific DNA-methyltransferase (adenine-specific)